MLFTKRDYSTNDQALLQMIDRAKQGDSNCFGKIYLEFAPKIYRYLYFKVDTVETAQDLTQETFIKAYQKLHYFKEGEFINWLYTIAHNTLIDHYRTHKQNLTLYDSQINLVTDKDDAEAILITHQLKSYLSYLSDKYREIVILRYLEDLPVKQVAEITGLSSSNIRVICTRAIDHIRNKLNIYVFKQKHKKITQKVERYNQNRSNISLE